METLGSSDFERLLSLSADIYLILDGKKYIKYASEGVKTIGYSKEDVLNTSFLSFVAGHVRPLVEKRLAEATNRKVFDQRVILKSKENVYVPYLMTFYGLADRVFVSLRREYEGGLEKAILDFIDFGIIVIDKDFRIMYHNNFVSSYFQMHSFTHLEQLPYSLGDSLIERISLGQKSFDLQYAPGKFVGITVYSLEQAEFSGYVIKLKDISEERSFQKSASGSGAYFSYVDLVSIYTHHIKNLLTPLKFTALNLKRELSDPSQLEKVERMIKHIDKINHHVRAFYSRVRTKPIEFKKCSVKKIVDKVKSLLSNDIINNGIIFEFHQESNDFIYVDEVHTQQILLDLMQNAIDAMKSVKGVRKLQVNVEQSGTRCPYCGTNFVEIEVKDTGPGIKKEDIDRIFNLGFSTKAEGWGLGLYVVDKMVKENKGIIRVFSEVGKGTSFVLYFHTVTPEAIGCVNRS
ncbi:MAG TPA: ATP-binding protein [Candidatus Hydrothermia bacterium]|nr:hypothetical protein [Candidatus Hydrothermae bacterium]MDD3649132.1 ATP-binding protein [Candidatus Hydrothermia bacterium]MDD5572199.1 ATP-binding protein [Candidatus Hydrothermia bacterium]HOK23072.1 ATP-binding protein [Candidatus Hydrothermia bacterium]HOL23668.1 ATP-binding protein [Candidatus Hydrothermia bacterium]